MSAKRRITELEQTVERLERHISSQQNLIASLERMLQPALPMPGTSTWPFRPVTLRCDQVGQVCEYPSPWGATVPPSCKKCGMSAQPLIVTSHTTAKLDGLNNLTTAYRGNQ